MKKKKTSIIVDMKDISYVPEMLELRKQGWSYPALGKKFGKDHTTCIYWVKKYGVKAKTKPKAERPVRANYMTYHPPEGKTYRDYLNEEEKRRLGKLAFLLPKNFGKMKDEVI